VKKAPVIIGTLTVLLATGASDQQNGRPNRGEMNRLFKRCSSGVAKCRKICQMH
jgi:thioredoxin reductase